MEEFDRLKQAMHTTSQIAAVIGTSSDIRSGSDLIEDVSIDGVTPNYSDVRSFNVASGRLLNEADESTTLPWLYWRGRSEKVLL